MSEMLDYSPIAIRDPADTLIAFGYQQVRFLGSVSVVQLGGQTQITIGGGAAIAVQDEGVPVVSTGTLNFIGTAVNVVNNAGTADITISAAPIGSINALSFYNGAGVLDTTAITEGSYVSPGERVFKFGKLGLLSEAVVLAAGFSISITAAIGNNSYKRISSASDVSSLLNSTFSSTVPVGTILTLENSGSFNITLLQDTTNRLPLATDFVITPNSTICLIYNGTRWVTLFTSSN